MRLADGRRLLDAFAALKSRRAEVLERLQRARDLERASILDPAEGWRRARMAVAADVRFGGLELTPQMGLVPLGPDPGSGLQEFADLLTGRAPVRDAGTGRLAITPETGVIFVLLPGGRVLVGSGPEASGPNPDPDPPPTSGPVNEVLLAPFLLSKHEFTQAQWNRLMGDNPSTGRAPMVDSRGVPYSELHPVEGVSWTECTDALRRARMVLPTEVQWEHACRAGTATPWYTGADVASLQGHANLADEGTLGSTGRPFDTSLDDGWFHHAPVGSYRPNPFGLHDMHGNVYEWCRDHYASYDQPARDGDGWRVGSLDPLRVLRGGSCNDRARWARSAARHLGEINRRQPDLGCRPALMLDKEGGQ
jgi:formylglycine-generating enzyme required for sulfatase activity